MCRKLKTPSRPDDLLCSGTQAQRSNSSQDPTYRRTKTSASHHSSQGKQRSHRARVTEVARRATRVLENQSPRQLSLPWQDAGHSALLNHHSESPEAGSRPSQNQQGQNHAAMVASTAESDRSISSCAASYSVLCWKTGLLSQQGNQNVRSRGYRNANAAKQKCAA